MSSVDTLVCVSKRMNKIYRTKCSKCTDGKTDLKTPQSQFYQMPQQQFYQMPNQHYNQVSHQPGYQYAQLPPQPLRHINQLHSTHMPHTQYSINSSQPYFFNGFNQQYDMSIQPQFNYLATRVVNNSSMQQPINNYQTQFQPYPFCNP